MQGANKSDMAKMFACALAIALVLITPTLFYMAVRRKIFLNYRKYRISLHVL